MAATYKFVLSTWLDTVNPSDAMQITPTFHHKLVAPELDTMANDLLDGWQAWMQVQYRTTQMRVTIYDVAGARPNYPKELIERNTGAAVVAGVNRDVALCLSAYADNNRPRQRGRLYIPCVLGLSSIAGANANAAAMQKIADLVPLFEGLGGVDWDWGVYSRVANQFRKYTNFWVDNAWDTQRRRGKRASARQTGTTSG
jgi:hypothetical protein